MPRLFRTLSVVGCIGLVGCVTVKPWQRGDLASPAMQPTMGDADLDAQYQAKVLESRTGGGLPGSAPGGGCGCTQ